MEAKVISLKEWEAMKRYVVVANVKLKSEKNSFLRVIGPFPTRNKAASARLRYKKGLEKRDEFDYTSVESFTISVTTMFADEMFRNDWTITGGN